MQATEFKVRGAARLCFFSHVGLSTGLETCWIVTDTNKDGVYQLLKY